jgi:flavin-dependent dehydrogenase
VQITEDKKDVTNDFDIMIVGGGPAGISALLHLQKEAPDLASRCILIEKEKYPRQKLCGGAVGGWAEDVLNSLEIKLKINSLMIDNVECKFGDDKYTLNEKNYFRMVDRKEFDHFLAKEAMKRGTTISQGEKFCDFKRDNGYIIVETNKMKYKLKALVGADGSLSNVRKKINRNIGKLAPALEIFSPANKKVDSEYIEKKVVLDFTPIKEGLQGYVWHFPCLKEKKSFINHGIVNFRICNIPSKKLMKNVFTEELQKRNIVNKELKLLGHPIRCFFQDDIISEKNVFLIGDAAGIEPATGGGIHLALSYGSLAANNLVKSYRLNDFSFKDYKNELNESLTGRYINKLSHIAYDMYSQKICPLDGIKKIFVKRKD